MMVPALKSAGAKVWAVCSGKNRALVEGLGADRVLDYTQASFGSQLASEGRCVDSTVDLLGGRDTHRQGLAITRKQGSFVTVVGPEQHVGQRRLSAFQLMGMLGRISWSTLGSRFSGPRYVFAAPLAPDWGVPPVAGETEYPSRYRSCCGVRRGVCPRRHRLRSDPSRTWQGGHQALTVTPHQCPT